MWFVGRRANIEGDGALHVARQLRAGRVTARIAEPRESFGDRAAVVYNGQKDGRTAVLGQQRSSQHG